MVTKQWRGRGEVSWRTMRERPKEEEMQRDWMYLLLFITGKILS